MTGKASTVKVASLLLTLKEVPVTSHWYNPAEAVAIFFSNSESFVSPGRFVPFFFHWYASPVICDFTLNTTSLPSQAVLQATRVVCLHPWIKGQ